MEPLRVMVTGAGSGVGQGIIKALRFSSISLTIIAADIEILNSGLFIADESLIIPRVENEGALQQVIDIIEDKRIQVVMIGSEFDLSFFSENKSVIEKETGATVIVSPHDTVKIANDKWFTVEFLRKNNLPYPKSFLPLSIEDALEQAEELGYPFIIKTRTGTSSRHQSIVNDIGQLINVYKDIPNPLLQQLIDIPSHKLQQEYTCSIFKCLDGSLVGPFTARRTLRGGSSWVIEVDAFERIYPLLLAIGNALPIMGSLNIQLMIGPNGPIPFEFNARFSGTTAVRAYFGFNEPELSLKNYIFKEKIENPTIRKGLALRYLEEVFVEGVNADELVLPLPRGEVVRWF
ncbi:MAG: ATP-grasp domain-containing protein [Syntrophomonas sp.]